MIEGTESNDKEMMVLLDENDRVLTEGNDKGNSRGYNRDDKEIAGK